MSARHAAADELSEIADDVDAPLLRASRKSRPAVDGRPLFPPPFAPELPFWGATPDNRLQSLGILNG